VTVGTATVGTVPAASPALSTAAEAEAVTAALAAAAVAVSAAALSLFFGRVGSRTLGDVLRNRHSRLLLTSYSLYRDIS
jgi:hypothetical protein